MVLIRDALLKSILKGKFLSRTGAKVRMDLVLYLEENREKQMSPVELIALIIKLTKKYSQADHAQTVRGRSDRKGAATAAPAATSAAPPLLPEASTSRKRCQRKSDFSLASITTAIPQ